MERKWVIAAFLDISGFRAWTYRAATAPETKEKLFEEFYKVLQCYVRTNITVWSKYEGDGILAIKEFAIMRRQPDIVNFLLSLKDLLKQANRCILAVSGPPGGARIRLMDGYVYKFMVLDPNDPERVRMIPEYLEYCTNTVRGLLDVNPEIPCLATSSLVKNIGKGRSIFRVRPLGKPSFYPKGVNTEDIDGLQILKF